MSGINTKIADHFKLFFRDVPDQPCDKLEGRNGFGNKDIIFMPVIMKGNGFAVIGVNARGGNNRSPKISANVFDHGVRLAVF